MKSVLRYTAAGVALATFGFASNASAATSVTANARAEIMTTLDIKIDATDNMLDFGQITPLATLAANSTVIVPASAAPTVTCGANLTCAGVAGATKFNVTGLAGAQVNITLPGAGVQLSNPVTSATLSTVMDLSAWTSNAASNRITLTGGAGSFYVGATLTVKPNQAPGTYTGTFPISVAYN